MSLAAVRPPDIGAAIARTDFWRRSPASAGGAPGHKEWSYFCVLGDEIQLVTAFSIMDRPSSSPAVAGHVEEARVTLLVRFRDGSWAGDIDLCDAGSVTLAAGRIDACFGRSDLAFTREGYRLRLCLGAPPITMSLLLRPIARPAVTRSVPLGLHAPMHWFVVPRLEATGELQCGGRRHLLRALPAYHDHNWGRFEWGGDFAWEWAIAVSPASNPWSLIYYRIMTRGRHAVVSQGILVWQGDRHCRTFREIDISVRSHGFRGCRESVRLPRVMQLAIEGRASDLPRRLEITARAGADAVDVAFDLADAALIGVPDDDGDGMTTIVECHARATVGGRIAGGAVQFACNSVVEFNRAAP